MAERMRRSIPPAAPQPSASDGSTRLFNPSSLRDVGNQPSSTANSTMKIKPTQKEGAECPKMAKARAE